MNWSSQLEIVIMVLVRTGAVLLVLAVLHVAFSVVFRTRSESAARDGAMVLAVLTIGGSAWLWSSAELHASAELKVSAICLFLAGVIVYIECRSLLSRGYSLRILVDLLQRGGRSELSALKDQYGNGMGIEGIIRHRLAGMVALGLLDFDGVTVGPLSRRGRILSVLMSGMRRLLRLERVG